MSGRARPPRRALARALVRAKTRRPRFGRRERLFHRLQADRAHGRGSCAGRRAHVRGARRSCPAVEAVAGVELGGCPLASAVSLTSFQRGRPLDALYVRKEQKDHGSKRLVEGDRAIVAGMPVVVLEDVVTTGGLDAEGGREARASGREGGGRGGAGRPARRWRARPSRRRGCRWSPSRRGAISSRTDWPQSASAFQSPAITRCRGTSRPPGRSHARRGERAGERSNRDEKGGARRPPGQGCKFHEDPSVPMLTCPRDPKRLARSVRFRARLRRSLVVPVSQSGGLELEGSATGSRRAKTRRRARLASNDERASRAAPRAAEKSTTG